MQRHFDYRLDPIAFHGTEDQPWHIMAVARRKTLSTSYDIRIDYIARLLRRAIRSGEKGLQESEASEVQNSTSAMIRTYETALKCSLDVSLTKRDCESIDEKSHRIELLWPRLEQKITELNREQPGTSRGKAAYDPRQPAELFIERCTKFMSTAYRMRQMNNGLMRRADRLLERRSWPPFDAVDSPSSRRWE